MRMCATAVATAAAACWAMLCVFLSSPVRPTDDADCGISLGWRKQLSTNVRVKTESGDSFL
jgi:hypothetical protein